MINNFITNILNNKDILTQIVLIISPILFLFHYRLLILFNKILNKIFKTKNKNYINQKNAKNYLKKQENIKEINNLEINNKLQKQINKKEKLELERKEIKIRNKELEIREKELDDKLKNK